MTTDARPKAENAPEASEAVEKPQPASTLSSWGSVAGQADQGWKNEAGRMGHTNRSQQDVRP